MWKRLRIFLSIFFILFLSWKAEAQNLITTFVDPCTKAITTFVIPASGPTTIYFYGQYRQFTAADVSSGVFSAWVNQVYADYRKISPCSVQQASVTRNQITSNVVSNVVSSVIGSIGASMSSSVSSTNVSTNNGGGNDNASKGKTQTEKKKDQNGNNSGNNNNSTSNSGGSGNASTNSSNNGSGNVGGQSNNQSNTTNNGNNQTNNQQGPTGGQSNSQQNGGNGQGSTGNSGTVGGGGGGSTTGNQTGNGQNQSKSEEKGGEVVATTTTNVEVRNDKGSENSSSSSGGGSKKSSSSAKQARNNPLIVSSDLTSAQNLDKSFTGIVNVGMSQSSLLGTSSWGVTSMVWLNFKQFALNGRYTMMKMNKSGKIKFVHNINLTGAYSYGNVFGFLGYSVIVNAGKWGITGGNISGAVTKTPEDKNLFISPSVTAFYTKPFQVNKKFTVSPEIYLISTPVVYSSIDKITVTDRYFSGFLGSGFDYQLSKRFKINVNYKANLSTNPEFPILSFFLVGSKINL